MTNGSGEGGRRLRQLLQKENDDVLRSHTLLTVKLAETGTNTNLTHTHTQFQLKTNMVKTSFISLTLCYVLPILKYTHL